MQWLSCVCVRTTIFLFQRHLFLLISVVLFPWWEVLSLIFSVFTSYNSLHLPESHHPNCLFLYSFCFIFSFGERLSRSQSPYLIRLLLFLSVDFGSGSEFGHKNLHGSKFRSMWIWSESSMLTALTVTTKTNNYNMHLVSLGEWHWIAGIISPHFFCTYVGSEGLILS